MKVWQGFGTEHSMNLKMIGYFTEPEEANEVKEALDRLIAAMEAEQTAGQLEIGEPLLEFSGDLLALMRDLDLHLLGLSEVEQFLYAVDIAVEGQKIVIETDEMDVMAFIKVLVEKGAKVEMYSAHLRDASLGGGQ